MPLHPDIDLEHVSDQIVDRFTIYLFVTCFRRSEMTGSCTGTSLAFSTQIWIGLRNDLPPHSFGLPDSLSVELRGFGYEPVGFVRPADAADAYRVERARFVAALTCHQLGTTAGLDFATALHCMAPSLPIILATPSARDLGPQILAASGISEVVRCPLASAELSRVLTRCLPSSTPALLPS